MAKKDIYRKIYENFKTLCSQGKQPGSFSSYCKKSGVSFHNLLVTLGKEYTGVRNLKGFRTCGTASTGSRYMAIYEEFKALCMNGDQHESFSRFCQFRGVNHWSAYNFLKRQGLSVRKIPGYEFHVFRSRKYQEIPFEDIIFEEAGFLPAEGGHVITVRFDSHVSVSFPADTDVETIARFVSNLGKEAGHVGS